MGQSKNTSDHQVEEALDLRSIDADFGRRLLGASPDCMLLLDADGRLQTINAAGCAAFLLEDEAGAVGRAWGELWPAGVAADAAAALEEARQGRVVRFAAALPARDGRLLHWDSVISPIVEGDARRSRMLVIARDVTQQRHVESRFRALADTMAPLAWMADPSGHIFWFNKRWLDYTGAREGDLESDGWLAFHHPEHAERVRAGLAHSFETREPFEDTFPLRAADGSYNWFLCRVMPSYDEAGRLQLWCATSTDISEQRNLGARLRQKARLIELSHEAIFAWAADGQILLWNNGCEELYGFSRSEALGAKNHELLKTVDPLLVEEIRNALNTEGTWSGALVQVRKDGRVVAVDSRQEMMRIDGRDVVLVTNRDMTAGVQAERIREVLIGELHHRVNNMLAIVQSMAAQTARNSTSMDQFLASLNVRLMALSGTHGVLSNSNWIAANLRDLINIQVAGSAPGAPNVEISGPDASLPAQTAIQLGLVLCELASNARRHGALSRRDGRVAITWDVVADADKRRLALMWREIGGPPITPPARRGFGLSLIERFRNLPYLTLNLSFEPDGLVCQISAELPDVTVDPVYFGVRKKGTSAGKV